MSDLSLLLSSWRIQKHCVVILKVAGYASFMDGDRQHCKIFKLTTISGSRLKMSNVSRGIALWTRGSLFSLTLYKYSEILRVNGLT